jgi:hypothetical protein
MIPCRAATFTKHLLLCILFITFCNSLSAQAYLSEDFNAVTNPGLPEGWTAIPAATWITGAPNTLAPNALAGLNFSLNTAGHGKALGIDGRQATVDPAAISSPRLSLPATATNTVLTFDVAFFGIQSSNDPPETEGLIFMVSTDDGATWSDVAFVAPLTNPSSSVWDSRSIPMGMYAGQSNLKFGFRYNNEGGTLIGAVLDNIRLVNGVDGIVAAAFAGDHPDPSTGTGYQLAATYTLLTGTVQNTGASIINNYYIKYRVGNGAIQSSPLITTPVAPLATADFPAGLRASIPANATYTVKAWIEVPCDADHANDTFFATTVGVPSIPVKRPVLEEGTGTWCGWCPRGAVFMDHFFANHPAEAAAQIAVHNNDPMTVAAYSSYMSNYAGGFPNLVIDRSIERDPKLIDTAFSVAQRNFGFADFTMGTPLVHENMVSIPVTIKPVVTIVNPKLALVITERNVTGSGGNWPQNNYYSGGGSGAMGGWEAQPGHVPDVPFHFVARSITPSPGGDAGALPATLYAGDTYTATLSAVLDTGWKRKDLQYIALLINGNNTSIMNSASTDTLSAPGTPDSSSSPTKLFPNPTAANCYLNMHMKADGDAVISVYDITGRLVMRATQQLKAGAHLLELETKQLIPGNYMVHLTTGKDKLVLKLSVVH